MNDEMRTLSKNSSFLPMIAKSNTISRNSSARELNALSSTLKVSSPEKKVFEN